MQAVNQIGLGDRCRERQFAERDVQRFTRTSRHFDGQRLPGFAVDQGNLPVDAVANRKLIDADNYVIRPEPRPARPANPRRRPSP